MALSKAAQMREKKQQGMSVGDIGRLFGVSYHYAYQVTVVHAGRTARAAAEPAAPSATALAAMSWPQLFAVMAKVPEPGAVETRAQIAARVAATNAADNKDPSGAWLDRFEAWKKVRR